MINRQSKDTVKKDTEKQELKFPDKPADSVFNLFQQGDVLFGLLKPRNEVGEQLESKGFTYVYANNLNNPVVEAVVDQAGSDEIKKFDLTQQKHFNFLNKHRDYLVRAGGKPFGTGYKYSPAYRRACKLILNKRTNHFRAHFVTQDIDWERVCDKNKSDKGITDSELRSAYRNFTQKGINRNILFYDKDNRLLTAEKPPWRHKKNKKHWRLYDEQRREKAMAKQEETGEPNKKKLKINR